MKKVININFQGQVIAIEETAYEILKQYIESLKNYFSREEDGDEIVNDIENRIAELFGNRLKLGINCITDEDVEAIINSIGRPEEFDMEYEETVKNEQFAESSKEEFKRAEHTESRSLNRNGNDKIIGGVCSGLANYFKTDPTWIRLVFVLFFGVLFWVYVILWIVLKAKPMESNVSKRIYRNPNDRYIGGVCGGIAAYFKIDAWIPRLLFVLPLFVNIFGMVSFFPMNYLFRDLDFNWNINGGVVLLYILLWIIIPEAKSVKQKLEMMGEEEYIQSIRNKVTDNVSGSKGRTEQKGQPSSAGMPPVPPATETEHDAEPGTEPGSEPDAGTETDHSSGSALYASSSGRYASDSGQHGSTGAHHASNSAHHASTGVQYSSSERSGCLNVILVFLKIVFFTFVGFIGLIFLAVVFGLFFAGSQIMPLKSLFIDPGFETTLLYLSTALILILPLIAIVVWIIRRIMKAKSRPVIGVVATVLWVAGLILSGVLASNIAKKYNVESSQEKIIAIAPVDSNKLYVDLLPYREDYSPFKLSYGFHSYRNDIDELPYTNINEDSLLFNNVNLQIGKSSDSLFHVRVISASKGRSLRSAKEDIDQFTYNIVQKDSLLLLPEFLSVPIDQGFRDQSVTVEISVPVGKSVEVSDALNRYKNNRPPSVVRKRIRAYESSYTPYHHSSLEYTFY